MDIADWLNEGNPIYSNAKYFLTAIVIVLIVVVLSKISRRALKRHFEKSDHLGTKDQTNYLFLKNGVNFIFFILGTILVFYTVPSLRALGLTLFAGAGIFAAIIGFASQQAFSNIIGGIFIVIFKPFRVNDVIKVGDQEWGIVENITIRHTVIRSFRNQRYIIPNSTMSAETILNSSIDEAKTCMFLEMGISYDSDVELAMKIMREEGLKHPICIDNRTQNEVEAGVPQIVTRLIGFGDSSVNLRAYIWAADPINGFVMKTDLYKSIKKRFDAEGIEIPFPYRTIVYKNPNEKPN
ncbi:MAG: mechanosensitive ion channel protein MscS [Verrucomicrobia bacterium]|nr:mechanosensitive ion channel protein MscS [Verrucomicrobiota bacterium]